MSSIDFVQSLLAFLPVFYLSAFAHEAGHAILGRAVGLIITSFGLGTAHPMAVFAWGHTRVFFCREKPFQGLTFCFIARISPSRTQMVPFMAGGIIANSLLCGVAICLWRFVPWGKSVWLTAALLNGFLAGANLIPHQIRVGKATIRSDANQILRTLRKRTNSLQPPVIIMSVKALRGLWESIGDYLILRANLLSAASAWLTLGDIERAEMVCSELGCLPQVDVPSYLAREALVRSAIIQRAGRVDDAVAALDAPEAYFRSVGDALGLACVALQRALAKVQRGDAASAVVELEQLMSDPVARSSRALRDDLWIARFAAHAALSDTAALEEMVARGGTLGHGRHSPPRELLLYQSLARLYAQKADWARAEPAFRRAITAIDAVAKTWPDAEEQHRFLQRQSAFLDEARHCFQALNKSEEADRLIRPVASLEEIQQRLDDAPRLRHRRLLRAGLWMLLVDVVCIPCLLVLGAFLPAKQLGLHVFVTLSLFVLYTFCTLLYLVFHAAIARFIPRLRNSGGAVILLLALLPWFSLVFIPIFSLLQSAP
jgi:hypothetical protein